jgi:hypothetical protein
MTAVAGKRAGAADVQAITLSSSGRPMVRLVQQATQTLTSDVDTAITFATGSEDFDLGGWHDVATNTSRITPTSAGYIRLYGTVWLAADTDLISIYASIGKNGTIFQRNRLILPSTATASAFRSVTVTASAACNGTTDYFELFGRQLQASAASLSTNVAAGGFSSTFEVDFQRAS